MVHDIDSFVIKKILFVGWRGSLQSWSSSARIYSCWIWHLFARCNGCRSFTGPIPQL